MNADGLRRSSGGAPSAPALPGAPNQACVLPFVLVEAARGMEHDGVVGRSFRVHLSSGKNVGGVIVVELAGRCVWPCRRLRHFHHCPDREQPHPGIVVIDVDEHMRTFDLAIEHERVEDLEQHRSDPRGKAATREMIAAHARCRLRYFGTSNMVAVAAPSNTGFNLASATISRLFSGF